MSTKRMLIDAAHPEETRVVVVDGNRLEEYDVEVATRRQLKGNIYLAKVTRVEPSLQAAFVDYGGNRHGFLAFSEIHPDYYQIPVADRQALLAEHAAAERAAEEAAEDEDDDELERRRPRLSPRNYKIQEVIKRRQILLVQVTKEERGTKGAALTTYLSLAGRYCVLMPNTSRGGGISRKISNVTDRKRLKKIISELEVNEGMAVIVRTAGAGRTKAEIKRDYEYLVRLWSSIRDTTLHSTAPALVYEEGNLIKRSIRDLYGRETEEIVIQGEQQYKIAKEFMKLFIPSHAKRVKLYEDKDRPLFHQAQIEDQIEAMHQPIVQLRSGSYIVINPTEALVSIDVNSGRATRERHIEETALRTNLEAADEIARQLRLRDLAGLIVIDFIDMENPRNQALVERRLKEAMKSDRARIQIGRISPFGLLELSRQRMRPSVIETSFEPCPMCAGTGTTRTIESAALSLIRRIEDEGIRHHAAEIIVTAGNAIALYLLNYKRRTLSMIEERYGFAIRVVGDPTMVGNEFKIERSKTASLQPSARVDEEAAELTEQQPAADEAAEAEAGEDAAKRSRRRRPRRRRRADEERGEVAVADAELIGAAEDEAGLAAAELSELANTSGDATEDANDDESEGEAIAASAGDDGEADDEADQAKKRRRRGKRGGRRRGRRPADAAGISAPAGEGDDATIAAAATALAAGGADEALGTGTDEAFATGADVDEDDDADEGDVAEQAEPLTPFSTAAIAVEEQVEGETTGGAGVSMAEVSIAGEEAETSTEILITAGADESATAAGADKPVAAPAAVEVFLVNDGLAEPALDAGTAEWVIADTIADALPEAGADTREDTSPPTEPEPAHLLADDEPGAETVPLEIEMQDAADDDGPSPSPSTAATMPDEDASVDEHDEREEVREQIAAEANAGDEAGSPRRGWWQRLIT